MTDGVLTTAQVARRLHRSLSTVVRMAADGRLKGQKLPGRTSTYLFAEDEVERFELEAAAAHGSRERA